MNPELEKKWKEAEETGREIPLGNLVVCDLCNEDYTESEATGGFIFGSSAYCPKCAPYSLQQIRDYREEHLILARALPCERFCDFVIRARGRDATIRVIKGSPLQ